MKKILLIVSILVVVIAIPVTIYLVSQRQEIRNKAAPATTLSISPATITKNVGDQFPLDVLIDSGKNQVVAVELHVRFDPEKLQAETITNGALFPNVLASGIVEPGAASITVGAPSTTKPVTGSGSVAVVRFKALAPASSPVSVAFAGNTFVSGIGEASTNVLVGSTGATITISGKNTQGTGESSASASPPVLPTPSLLPSPTSTGSGAATSSGTLKITSPVIGGSTASEKPTISGKAAPGSKVTITIYSTPITVVVTADANGNWTYTPTTPLDPGPHSIVATAQSSGSATLTTTSSFVVATGSATATQSATPVSGNVELTLIILTGALLLVGTGIAIPVFSRKPYG